MTNKSPCIECNRPSYYRCKCGKAICDPIMTDCAALHDWRKHGADPPTYLRDWKPGRPPRGDAITDRP